MEQEEDKETVLVPVRRREATPKKEFLEEPPEPDEAELREMPRRWYIY